MSHNKSNHTSGQNPIETSSTYARYVLGVLVVVYVLNFLDRQILSILNEEIKADLGLSDAQMGFLYGTAFAVFYAVFGLPLGRLADVWDRRRLISIGLAFWSTMTAVSGLTKNFTQLALARIGVGVGEASATPAAFSLLSDYFPARQRATVLAIYSSGIYIGGGLSLGIGGIIVDSWNAAYAPGTAPFGLAGWQVAFFVVGLPGLALALWVRSLHEPVRGLREGIHTPMEAHPFRVFFHELRAVLPPFTLLHILIEKFGTRALIMNLLAAALISVLAWGMTQWLGSPAQWIALGIGLYSAYSWLQALKHRDRPTYVMIAHSKALHYTSLTFALLAFTGYSFGYWSTPFFIRVYEMSASSAGWILGGMGALGGFLGVTLGGFLSDHWRKRTPNGRLWVGVLTATASMPIVAAVLLVPNKTLALALAFPAQILTSMWVGAGASTVQDLVLPRMRATTSAAYLLVITFIGLALGPYSIGRMSVAFDDLRMAMLAGIGVNVLAIICAFLAMRHLRDEEASVTQRARNAGEPLAPSKP